MNRRLGIAALAVGGVLAVGATVLADGGISIRLGIPFGRSQRQRTIVRQRHSVGPYRYGSRPAARYSRRPSLGLGFTYVWGNNKEHDRRHDDRDVRRVGRRARESTRDLIRALRNGGRKERERAARELGKLPVDDVRGALEEALLRDPVKDVRKEAAKALGKLGDEQSRPVLRRAALRDPSKRVREAAERALRELRPRRPGRPVIRPRQGDRYDRDRPHGRISEVEALLYQLEGAHKHERVEAAEKLGKLRARRAVPALIVALGHARDEEVREAAAKALGRIADRAAVPALRQAARHDPDDDVREEAREALEDILD